MAMDLDAALYKFDDGTAQRCISSPARVDPTRNAGASAVARRLQTGRLD